MIVKIVKNVLIRKLLDVFYCDFINVYDFILML